MESDPITSWQIEGKKWKQWQILFSWAPKSLQTANLVMKLMLALWNESYDKSTQCIKKLRHHFANKDPYSQNCGFSSSHVWMWELAECRRIDAFELWCWRRFLRVCWIARRSNQSVLKEINLEYSLERLMLKLKLQYLANW